MVMRRPSPAVYTGESKLTLTCGRSSSVMSTVVAAMSPTRTRSGRAPASIASSTDSPASNSSSATALKVNSCSVSPARNVILDGAAS